MTGNRSAGDLVVRSRKEQIGAFVKANDESICHERYSTDDFRMMLNAAIQEGEQRGRKIERAALYTVPFDVVRAVAELPDRTSPDGDPEMMRVTTKELLGIVRSAIDATMNAENGNG